MLKFAGVDNTTERAQAILALDNSHSFHSFVHSLHFLMLFVLVSSL